MDRALIIKKKWSDRILDNRKTIEMRSTKTHIRGKVGIIESGTGLIVGEVEIIGCGELLTEEAALLLTPFHQVEDLELLKKWRYAWLLARAKRYENPVPYKHPKGAVIWVKI